MEYQHPSLDDGGYGRYISSTNFDTAFRSYDGYVFLCCCVCAVSRLSTFHTDCCSLWVLPVFRLCDCPLRCVHTLKCVYLIHLSLWYCKSRQRSFVRFFWYCVLADHRKLLCVALYGTVVLAVRWYCGGRPNCNLWLRLFTLQWSDGMLTHSSHCVQR